jgi:hypothetical protein
MSAAPSYSQKNPSDCLQTMSRETCEEIFKAEQGNVASSGPSFNVERCLAESSRTQCEAQLAAQIEAEYAASKGE